MLNEVGKLESENKMETIEEKELFHKYPSIENSYRNEFIEKIKMHGFANEPYCITEKIHGSNTQICYNYKTKLFEYGKRTCKLQLGESCYNVQNCFELVKDSVVHLAQYLASKLTSLETVIVYGEVFGGNYPHEQVERDNKASKVQKGVFYSNHNEWKAFDIAYTLENDERTYFLSGEDFFTVCNTCDIDTVPLLKVANTLNEALEYPNDNESVVFEAYNLPKLDNNIMEGVVIRPWKRDLWMGQSRVVLKNKNEKFLEKSHEKRPNVQLEVPEKVKKTMEEISTYITENRVNNVVSHLGEVTEKDIGKIIGLTNKDVLSDFTKESGLFNLLDSTEEKMVTRYLNSEVAKVVRKVILK